LADNGTRHHMTSVRRDFCEYGALSDGLLVKGINARAVGVGSVLTIVKGDDGEEILAMVQNVLHVLSYPVVRRGLTIGFSASSKRGDIVIVCVYSPRGQPSSSIRL
jgi:hypothetical protein